MGHKQQRPPVGELDGRQKHGNHGGGEAAVYIRNCTTSAVPRSILKQVPVAMLARVFEWSSSLAIALGHVVTSACAWFSGGVA